MNDVEEILRDTLAARATAVVPDPRAYEYVLARRRRSFRSVVVVGGAAAATAATAAIVVVTQLMGGAPVVPAPPVGPVAPVAAPYVGAVLHGSIAFFRVADMDNGSSNGPKDYRVVSVAALGDATHFWAGAVAKTTGCRSVIERYVRNSENMTSVDDIKGGGDVNGRVTEVAVSPDGGRLAYVMRAVPKGGTGCTEYQLHVRDLRTGTDRTWTDPTADPSSDSQEPSSLGWSIDSRHLVYVGNGCCDLRTLDVEAPGTSFVAPPEVYAAAHDPRPNAPRDAECEVGIPTPRGHTGQFAAVLRCSDTSGVDDRQYVAVVDPVTGKVGDVLFSVTGGIRRMTFDASGDHALVEVGVTNTYVMGPDGTPDPEQNPVKVFRWDRGGAVRDVTPSSGPSMLAW